MPRTIRLAINRLCLIATLMFTTIGCDQVTKVIARDTLPSVGDLSYFGGLLEIQHAQNYGAYLSIGAEMHPTLRFVIFTLSVAIFLLLSLWYLLRSHRMNLAPTIGWTLVVAGGIGNLIDRIAFGSVTDFLIVGFGALRTGIFNVADMAIMGGVGILMYYSWRKPKEA